MTGSQVALVVSTFLASLVECVEAFTIVLAIGVTRGWRSTLWGVAAALAILATVTAAAGTAIVSWLPEAVLKLVVGALLLAFGLNWLRKAVLRASGRKALHDEDATFLEEQAAATAAGTDVRLGIDRFAFAVGFKATLLEGFEVVFIVITFGANADSINLAAAGAAAACLVVLGVGAVVHRPLARVPENALKFAVGLLLSTFGTFWAVEGLGALRAGGESLAWPGGEWSVLALLAAYGAAALAAVRALR